MIAILVRESREMEDELVMLDGKWMKDTNAWSQCKNGLNPSMEAIEGLKTWFSVLVHGSQGVAWLKILVNYHLRELHCSVLSVSHRLVVEDNKIAKSASLKVTREQKNLLQFASLVILGLPSSVVTSNRPSKTVGNLDSPERGDEYKGEGEDSPLSLCEGEDSPLSLGKRCEKNYLSVRRYVADPDNAYPKRSITKLILKGAVTFDVVSYQFRCALNYSKLGEADSLLVWGEAFKASKSRICGTN
ncbi:hypothetical protein Tco_0355194 [Tanacetum coccineum]